MRAALLALAMWCAPLAAQDALETRLKRLETELRCLVCQNQTLADSDAPLAADLRREIRELAVAGRSDEDIRAFVVARYGDFVLYRPPFKPVTWLLWVGPFALLAGGGLVWWSVLRRRTREAVPHGNPASPDAEQRARELLE
jgi:cytochrome c-type biogenesis protein CcmH